MLKFSLKNRIAFYYIISTALLILLVFVIIYSIISFSINKKVDQHLNYETKEYLEKIQIQNNKIELIDNEEWEQREHNDVAVDPVFLEITDVNGVTIKKSENLKNTNLSFLNAISKSKSLDFQLSGQLVRQIQTAIVHEKNIKGYLIVAVSLEETTNTLNNLRKILTISFPLIIILLFFIARFIAGRSIKPISSIIETSKNIKNNNLKGRIELPVNKDEFHTLSLTINNLLDRIESTIEREKTFTSDASHELRTPLSVLKGTLEVLIRKPRKTEEYNDKISFCISEVDRINNIVDQLLLLARFENQKLSLKMSAISIKDSIDEILNRYKKNIHKKEIQIYQEYPSDLMINSDYYSLSIVIDNLISNAIKYTKSKGTISISAEEINKKTYLKIQDNGIGINEEELSMVFDSFYRTSNSTNYPEIKGSGLGLSIVKRFCDILNIDIEISSKENSGTTVTLIFAQ